MIASIENAKLALHEAVWNADLDKLPLAKAVCLRVLRLLYTVAYELADGQLNLRAMSLVYTTLLAMVPLLAVSFSVLKAFGVHNQLEQVLLNLLSPLGDRGFELTMQILDFVDNVKVGVLGSIGLGLLFYTAISMVQKVERAFNYTWRVQQPRNVMERVSDYLSVLIIGPVFVFSALGLTAAIAGTSAFQQLAAIEPLGALIRLGTQALPYLLVVAAFVVAYLFIPNTKVQLRAALTGGLVAGILWQSTGWGFASFVASATRYTAIYSSFAILVLFMIWIYLSWLILLVGASVAFYSQNPQYVGAESRELRLSNRLKERVALQALLLIARHHYESLPAWSLDDLAKRMRIPPEPVRRIFDALEAGGVLVQTAREPPGYVPARDFGSLRLREVLELVRSAEERDRIHPRRVSSDSAVDRLIARLDESLDDALGSSTVKDLAQDRVSPLVAMEGPRDPDGANAVQARREAGR